MQNLVLGIRFLTHSSLSTRSPQHREKGALLRTSSAYSTCDLGWGGRRGERASDQIRDSGRESVLWVIVPDLNLPLVCAAPARPPQEGECGSAERWEQDPRMPILPGGRAAIASRASVGLRGLFGVHFSEAMAGGIFGMVRPQSTLSSNHRVSAPEHMGRATGWASLVAWPMLLRSPECSRNTPALNLGSRQRSGRSMLPQP